jgi:hypothetical protein
MQLSFKIFSFFSRTLNYQGGIAVLNGDFRQNQRLRLFFLDSLIYEE